MRISDWSSDVCSSDLFVVSRNMPDVSEYLKDELERATVVDDEDIQPTVVTMGTTVTFRDEETQDVRRITLVYPDDADISEGKISVMTPVGELGRASCRERVCQYG